MPTLPGSIPTGRVVSEAVASFITEEMEAAVGRELSRTVSYPVSASDIRKWALAVYYPEPPPTCFWDPGAEGTGEAIVAPEDFNPFAWIAVEPAGPPPPYGSGGSSFESRLGVTEVPLQFMLNGGVDVEYGVPMRPGDVITAVSTLAGYSQRTGRLGEMLFTRTAAHWTNQRQETVKTTHNMLIRYGAQATRADGAQAT